MVVSSDLIGYVSATAIGLLEATPLSIFLTSLLIRVSNSFQLRGSSLRCDMVLVSVLDYYG